MSVLDNVDAATNLAKNNEVQLLVFRVSDHEDSAYYAINVFKTREVVESKNHYMTQIPSSHEMLEGTIVLRGMQIPILNLPLWLGTVLSDEEIERSNILICDFNGIVIGLRIMSAYRVIKKNWNEMHAPNSYRVGENSVVINDTRLEDGSLCLVLDYEKLLADVIPQAMVDVFESPANLAKLQIPIKLKNGTVLIAEDSKTAQKHLTRIFENANISMKLFENGKLLMDYINAMGDNVSMVPAVITDIEMPQMDGHRLTKLIKSDDATKDVPVIIFSSLVNDEMRKKGEALGADAQLSKPEIGNLVHEIDRLVRK